MRYFHTIFFIFLISVKIFGFLNDNIRLFLTIIIILNIIFSIFRIYKLDKRLEKVKKDFIKGKYCRNIFPFHENTPEKIKEILKESINNIEEKFYKVTSSQIENSVPRERIFCYELYHQLRLECQTYKFGVRFDISPELVKGKSMGYSEITNIPDFLFHREGTDVNFCILEVKAQLNKEKIKKDFETLSSFLNGKTKLLPYKIGIFLIFGYSFEEFIVLAKKMSLEKYNNDIIVMCKKSNKDGLIEKTLRDVNYIIRKNK